MFSRAYNFYLDSFQGFRREVWLLALVTFINRAGTMVIPFLSLYLTADMGLSLEQVGWIMSCFGAGSICGSFIGGKLCDKFGFYPVIAGSLLTSGSFFFVLQHLQGFYPFCIGIFTITLFADAFRPALFVALRSYSKVENRTRSVTLIRLAINLGFSMGPAIGGLIITYVSYKGLFWVDGITCILAGLLFLYKLPKKDPVIESERKNNLASRSPYKDWPYIFFLLTIVVTCIPFVQYFSTVPLFYKQVHHLNEVAIGLLLGFNGLLIFLTEMPLIKYCERRLYGVYHVISFSIVLFAMSYLVLVYFPSIAFLWIGMTLMTMGEMLNFPFMNRLALDRSDQGKPGAYMALFTISWSVAHIIGHNMGLHLVDAFGFNFTWYILAGVLVIAIGMTYIMQGMFEKDAIKLKAERIFNG